MKLYVLGIALMGIVVGCGSGDRAEAGVAMAERAGPASAPKAAGYDMASMEAPGGELSPPARTVGLIQSERRDVIRDGKLAVRVKSVEEAERQVEAIVDGAGGYVGSTSSSDLESEAAALQMSLRVRADDFDQAMAKLEALGSRISKSTQSRDVSTNVVDLEVRLKVLRAEELALRKALANANSQSDILSLRERIMRLREEIESIEGQRHTLKGQTLLSNIELTLQQSAIGAGAPGDPNWAQEAWGSASAAAVTAGRLFATVAIWALLFSPLWVPMLLVGWRAVRIARRPKPAPQA